MQTLSPVKLMLASAFGGFAGSFAAAQYSPTGFIAGVMGAGVVLAIYLLVRRRQARVETT